MVAVRKQSGSPCSVPTELEQVLSAKDLAIYREVVDALWNRYCGSRKKKQGSFDSLMGNVNRLTLYLRKPFWDWQTRDLDTWFGHLGRIEKLAISTQRIAQSNIACFLDFACEADNAGDIERRTGMRPKQVCTPEIRIPHRHEREGKRARRSFTDDHLDLFFDAIWQGIQEARAFNGKDQYSRERDQAMLYLCYALGLRREEDCSLTIRSFEPNPERPEFGDYGIWHIFGKGNKYRVVHAIDVRIRDVMEWYLSEVRPAFISIKTSNVDALFLSERGNPVSDDQLERGFRRAVEEAGLLEYGYTLHCLRHTYVSNATPIIGMDAVQAQVGHTFRATTEGYYHSDPKSIANQLNAGIDRTMKQTTHKKKD